MIVWPQELRFASATPASLTVTANATPPASSGSWLTATRGVGDVVSATWTTPNDPALSFSRLYAGGSDFATARVIGTSYAGPSSGAGLQFTALTSDANVWVVAFNASGVGAPALGPTTIPPPSGGGGGGGG